MISKVGGFGDSGGCGCVGNDKSISFFPGRVVLQLRRSVSVWAGDGRYVRSVVSRTHLRIATVADAVANYSTPKADTPSSCQTLLPLSLMKYAITDPPHHCSPPSTNAYQRFITSYYSIYYICIYMVIFM